MLEPPSPPPTTTTNHPIEVVPHLIHGSPADLPAMIEHDDTPEKWWTPGPADVARHLGWWWAPVILGTALVIAAAVLTFTAGRLGVAVWTAEVKLLVLLAGAGLSLFGFKMKRIVHARTDMFCIHCGYSLTGLPDDSTCPECGRPYAWSTIREYRKDPEFFKQRYRALHNAKPDHPAFDAGPIRNTSQSSDGT